MKKVFLLTAVATLGSLAACTPTLDTQPYPDTDREWVDYMQKAYPSWKPAKPLVAATPIPKRAKPIAVPQEVMRPHNFDQVQESPVQDSLGDDDSTWVGGEFTTDPVLDESQNTDVQPISFVAVKKGGTAVQAPSPNAMATYKVRQGDNFWRISTKIYGKGRYFKELEKANSQIKNKNVLRPNQLINVPVIEGVPFKNAPGLTLPDGTVSQQDVNVTSQTSTATQKTLDVARPVSTFESDTTRVSPKPNTSHKVDDPVADSTRLPSSIEAPQDPIKTAEPILQPAE